MSSGNGLSSKRNAKYKNRIKKLPPLRKVNIADTRRLGAVLCVVAVSALLTLVWWASDIVPPLFYTDRPNKWYMLTGFICLFAVHLVHFADRVIYVVNVGRAACRSDYVWQLRRVMLMVSSHMILILSVATGFYSGLPLLVSGGVYWTILAINYVLERYAMFKHANQLSRIIDFYATGDGRNSAQPSPRESEAGPQRQTWDHPIDDHDYSPDLVNHRAVMESYHENAVRSTMDISGDSTNYTTGSIELISIPIQRRNPDMPAVPVGSLRGKDKQALKRQDSPRELRSVDRAERSQKGSDVGW